MTESNYQREKRLLFEFLKTVEVSPQTVSSTGGSTTTTSPQPTSTYSPGTYTPSGDTPLLKKAVFDQSEYMFDPKTSPSTYKEKGEISGLCAGFSYNIAFKLKEHIDKKSNTAIPWTYTSSGNAYNTSHLNAIANLGGGAFYDKYYIGNKTRDEILDYLAKESWNYGDVVNYHTKTDADTGKYHTQIYTGDIYSKSRYWSRSKGIFKEQSGNSGWSTSNKTNYGTNFVYRSRGNVSYEFYVFKIKKEYLI